MLKGIKTLIILVLIIILATLLFRQRLCRILIEQATAQTTGLKLSIQDLNLNILNNSLSMGEVTLFNPYGFQSAVLGKAKEISILYDPLALLKGRLHLYQVKVEISEINIIKGEKGNSNVSAFKKIRPEPEVKAAPDVPLALRSLPQKSKPGKERHPRFLIDRLELSLEKVTFIDYSAEIGEAAVIIFTIKGPCVFKNVSELNYVADSVSVKGGFKSLLNNLLGRTLKACSRMPAMLSRTQ